MSERVAVFLKGNSTGSVVWLSPDDLSDTKGPGNERVLDASQRRDRWASSATVQAAPGLSKDELIELIAQGSTAFGDLAQKLGERYGEIVKREKERKG
jgi:hypothetical protein